MSETGRLTSPVEPRLGIELPLPAERQNHQYGLAFMRLDLSFTLLLAKDNRLTGDRPFQRQNHSGDTGRQS